MSLSSKFKVGDRIVALVKEERCYTIILPGESGEVLMIDKNGDCYCWFGKDRGVTFRRKDLEFDEVYDSPLCKALR